MSLCGIGYDCHRFAPERKLVLGGVEIPHTQGLHGHSDADVLIHAIVDALLGGAGLGDIGEHFPDTDERYRDADSMTLLETVLTTVIAAGLEVVNVDSTIIMEEPKIAAHKQAIRESLARALGLAPGRVNVKATTGEGMGFVGRGEGVAALAVVSLRSR